MVITSELINEREQQLVCISCFAEASRSAHFVAELWMWHLHEFARSSQAPLHGLDGSLKTQQYNFQYIENGSSVVEMFMS
jgi:hypothetical protein